MKRVNSGNFSQGGGRRGKGNAKQEKVEGGRGGWHQGGREFSFVPNHFPPLHSTPASITAPLTHIFSNYPPSSGGKSKRDEDWIISCSLVDILSVYEGWSTAIKIFLFRIAIPDICNFFTYIYWGLKILHWVLLDTVCRSSKASAWSSKVRQKLSSVKILQRKNWNEPGAQSLTRALVADKGPYLWDMFLPG